MNFKYHVNYSEDNAVESFLYDIPLYKYLTIGTLNYPYAVFTQIILFESTWDRLYSIWQFNDTETETRIANCSD